MIDPFLKSLTKISSSKKKHKICRKNHCYITIRYI